MKKYRRGSKIVHIVKRGSKYPNEIKECKVPNASSEPTNKFHKSGNEETVSNQRSISDQQVTVRGESLETALDDMTNNIITSDAPVLILPSTSGQTKSHYGNVQNLIDHCIQPANSTTLLNEDLYLTDSSDDTSTDSDESTSSSSSYSSDSSLKSSSCGSDNELPSSEGILPSGNDDGNVEADSTTISFEEHHYATRKRRQAVPSEWKKNIRKNKRQHGEPYVSAKGVLMPGRTLKESKCMGRCIHECTLKVSEEERLKIFSSFWNITTVEQKRLYIVNLIHREKSNNVKRKQIRKKNTNKYFLEKAGATERIRVCQKFFLATLNVSETFVRFCFKKVIDNNIVVGDKRGKHVPHNKIPKKIREHVRDHIKSFPRVPAPHVRKDMKREYLGRNLNLTKMYNMYKIKCDSEQRQSVELAYYRSVFNKDFNIGFHRPGRDICDICVAFERMNRKEKVTQKYIYTEHLSKINTARQHREEAKSLAHLGAIHFVEYDLKAICDCPPQSPNLKRSLPVYNFTLLDFNKQNRNVLCFCWHEEIARKGSTEIGSCLYKYLQSNADGKPITFMSDTCASQCRNMYISSLLLYCIEIFDIPEINQKYFEQGHSQMETDIIHANIEKAKKDTVIPHPSGYYNLIRQSLQKYPNKVCEMKPDDFIDLKYLKGILVKNAKIDYQGEPVNWLNIRWLQYRKNNPNYIFFKYDLSDTVFNRIEVIRRGKRQQNCKDIVLLKKVYEPLLL